MPVLCARVALLFDVGNLSIRGHFAVVPRHAAAAESREPKESNKTAHSDPPDATLSNSRTDRESRSGTRVREVETAALRGFSRDFCVTRAGPAYRFKPERPSYCQKISAS